MRSDYEKLAEHIMRPRQPRIHVWPVFEMDADGHPEWTRFWQDEASNRYRFFQLPDNAVICGVTWADNPS